MEKGTLVTKDWTYSIILAVQTQNDYICEWLPQKEDFLKILLDLEAPPLPHICKICGKDGVIQQWTGDFFEDSALHMTGLQLHLGHDGAPCPSASVNAQATPSGHPLLAGLDEEEWEDIDYIPLHLHPPVGSKYLTVINVTGVHFVLLWACQCMNAESYHKQLFWAKLYPSTFEKLSTAFTFLVSDDFLRDNVECGTSGMNYYSKLHQVTSMQQWHLLKLLKWSGFQDNKNGSTKGDLALFCTACPQPRINPSLKANLDEKVWLMDGCGFMVANLQYWEYIEATPHIMEKSACNNHKVISQASASHGKLNSTGVGATACAWHGCFYLHSVVDFQKGERQLNMDYFFCNALSYNMNSIQNVICFYDINCTYMKNPWRWVDNTKFLEIAPSLKIMAGIRMWHELLDFQMNDSNFMKMIHMSMFGMDGNHRLADAFAFSSLSWKLKVAWVVVSLAQEAFERLNDTVPSSQQENWWREEEAALQDHFCDPSVMDIFEIQLMKVPNHGSAPTVHGVELHLLQTSTSNSMHHGATSWLTCGLVIEEVEISLDISWKAIGPNPSDLKWLVIAHHEDRVAAEWTTFIVDGRIYLWMDTTLDDSKESDRSHEVASKNILVDDDISSNGGNSNCSADDMLDMDTFTEQTTPSLPLPSNLGADRCCNIGVHRLAEMELELHIAQANDALHGLHLALADKVVIFRGVVRTAMIALQGYKFKELAHRIIHWLCAKARKDCWEEEEELLTLEFQWAINYFQHCLKCWHKKYMDHATENTHGTACYAARQQAIYDQLAEQGELKWQQDMPPLQNVPYMEFQLKYHIFIWSSLSVQNTQLFFNHGNSFDVITNLGNNQLYGISLPERSKLLMGAGCGEVIATGDEAVLAGAPGYLPHPLGLIGVQAWVDERYFGGKVWWGWWGWLWGWLWGWPWWYEQLKGDGM
ncbi:hypothetical protein EDD17DRAFT_1514717 [Pisolithus thermaeus]|nr:hypothetical protein EDD17DRAFT_1514717 [Pisolithus thermaeus]